MNFKTDMGRVIGLGSAKSGASHWFTERLQAVALIPLTLGFLWIFAPIFTATHADVIAALHNPLKAIILILFFLVTFKHIQDGLQVVIEDYVHAKAALVILLVINKLIWWVFGLIGVFAVAKIAFSG